MYFSGKICVSRLCHFIFTNSALNFLPYLSQSTLRCGEGCGMVTSKIDWVNWICGEGKIEGLISGGSKSCSDKKETENISPPGVPQWDKLHISSSHPHD